MKKILSTVMIVLVIAQTCISSSFAETSTSLINETGDTDTETGDNAGTTPDPEVDPDTDPDTDPEADPDIDPDPLPDGGDVDGGTDTDIDPGNAGGDGTGTENGDGVENGDGTGDGTDTGTDGGEGEPTDPEEPEVPEEPEEPEYVFVPMSLSSFGLEMIKSFEGFHPMAYWDYSQWTIGYGTACEKNEFPNGITEVQATARMHEELKIHVNAVNRFIQNYSLTLNQNQFDALVSFSYNCGQNVWSWSVEDFTLKKLILAGNWNENEITNAFLMWVKAGGNVLPGLVKRRTREAALFNSDLDLQSSDIKYYFVATSSSELNIRPTASTAGTPLGSVKNTIIIPVTEFSGDGKWAYTPYAAFFGWVSTSYIRPLEDAPVLDENMTDSQGIKYTLGSQYKTIIAGVPGGEIGNALYSGVGDGNVYLSRYIRSGDYVYLLTEVAEGAFYGNTHLKTVYIPDSVKTIYDNSFSALDMIYCAEGTYAASYADKYGIPYMEYECRNGHTFENAEWEIVFKVTCTENGLEGLRCDVCGYVSETRVYKEALGHAYTEGKWQTVTELSCTTDHVEGILCENCGLCREERLVEKAPGHTYAENGWETLTEALCLTDGLEAIICTVCGGHVEERVINALGHKEGEWEIISEVSCTTDGVRIKKCTVCADVIKEDVTPSSHTYDETVWQTVKEPTCTKTGEKAVICTVCGEKVMTKSIAAKGHSYGEWYVKTKPTYLKKGSYRRDCERCSSYETKSIAVLETKIVSSSLKLDDKTKKLEGITVGTKVSDILSKIENSSDVKIIDKKGNKVASDGYVGSGMKLILFEGSKTLLSYSITVKGDADGNGLATDWDAILLGRYLAGWDVDISVEALDFDSNGEVNDWDEIRFSRYLAGWDEKLW